MKYTVTKICLLLSALFIMLSFHVEETLVRFIIMGEIPGTDVSLSPTTMLVVYSILILAPICIGLYKLYAASRNYAKANSHLPKRRYSPLA